MTKPKPGNTCSICGSAFETVTDHMIHVSTAHRPGDAPRRGWSCWRCAGYCDPDTAICPDCGWHHPSHVQA